MTGPEVDGLNAGYAALLLEQYLDNPSAVPEEWRLLFESAPEELLKTQPGLARLLERLDRDGNGHAPAQVVAPPPPAATPAAVVVDDELLGGVAAAMGGRFQRLSFAAVMIVAGCFFLGMMIAVVTSHPLW